MSTCLTPQVVTKSCRATMAQTIDVLVMVMPGYPSSGEIAEHLLESVSIKEI